jgi:hypothetical protein
MKLEKSTVVRKVKAPTKSRKPKKTGDNTATATTATDTTATEESLTPPYTSTVTFPGNNRTFDITMTKTGGTRRIRYRNEVHNQPLTNEIDPPSMEFNNARRRNQHMLQDLALSGREVEAGTNSNNIKHITRKRANRWSPQTAKERANYLANNISNHMVHESPVIFNTNIGRRVTKRRTSTKRGPRAAKKRASKKHAKKTHGHKRH